MAHFIVEYSANLGVQEIRIDALLEDLHAAALDTGLFPLAGIRSRAHCCSEYRVADGSADFAFAHVLVKVGAGRTEQELQQAFDCFAAVLDRHFEPVLATRGLALSMELQALPATLRINRNNLREYLQAGRE